MAVVLIATDDDVLALSAQDAVAVMWDAVAAHGAGRLIAPPRTTIALGDGAMTLTAGRLPGTAAGFRMYSSAAEAPSELTLVFQPTHEPIGVVLGSSLGRRRTGALGGVAAKLCSREDSRIVGLVGAGEQAFTQLWAICAVREITQVAVFSRNTATARTFSVRARAELDISVTVVGTAREAVEMADIVILSTPATAPLIEESWLSPGAHVHTLGPKGAAEGECPRSLAHSCAALVSDSPAQLLEMEGHATPWTQGRAVVSLGEMLENTQAARTRAEDITVYASVGLAGTEVLLARRVLSLADSAVD